MCASDPFGPRAFQVGLWQGMASEGYPGFPPIARGLRIQYSTLLIHDKAGFR
jgi:hypothetical protein